MVLVLMCSRRNFNKEVKALRISISKKGCDFLPTCLTATLIYGMELEITDADRFCSAFIYSLADSLIIAVDAYQEAVYMLRQQRKHYIRMSSINKPGDKGLPFELLVSVISHTKLLQIIMLWYRFHQGLVCFLIQIPLVLVYLYYIP